MSSLLVCVAATSDVISMKPEEKISKLQDKLEFRNRFQRMVVHDLRGPATSINLGADMALQKIKQVLRQKFKQNTNIEASFCSKKNRRYKRASSMHVTNIQQILEI